MHKINVKKGFTLIDLLLSVAIVSLLSSLFLFNVTDAKRKAEDGHMQAESHEVSSAITLYKNDHNGFVPLTSSGGAETGKMYKESDTQYQETMQILVAGGYIAEIPASPSGQNYSYGTSEDQTSGVFGAKLRKKSRGGSSNKNSCPAAVEISDQEDTPQYPEDAYYLFRGCVESSYSCQSGQINDGQVCFVINPQTIFNYCTYGSGTGVSVSDEYGGEYGGQFPLDICRAQISYTQENDNGYYFLPQNITRYYICDIDPIPPLEDDSSEPDDDTSPLCNGNSESDYCQCL